jgi:hypothetical protein
MLRCLIPGSAIVEGPTCGGDSVPDTEDAAFGEFSEQPFRDNPAVLQEMLQGPEGELGVVGWEANRATADISVRLVVAHRVSRARKPPFGRIPERVADRQTD